MEFLDSARRDSNAEGDKSIYTFARFFLVSTWQSLSSAYSSLGMQMLQCAYADLSALQCRNSLRCRTRSSQRRNRGDACHHRRPSNCLFVKPRFEPRGRIHDELDALALDEVDHVGPAFFHFVDALHAHACALDHVGGTCCRHQLEAHIHELAG